MRFAFLLSGAFGFLLVTAVGLGSGRVLDLVLRDAAVACLLSAFVGRWFWTGLESAFAQTLAARHAEAEAAEAAAAAATPAPPPPAARRPAAPAQPAPVPATLRR